MYEFPGRPLPELFAINILFTLVGLPVFVILLLYFLSHLNKWGKITVLLLVSLLMAVFEKFAEGLGFFQHSEEWTHLYTFIGYFLFLMVAAAFFHWLKRE